MKKYLLTLSAASYLALAQSAFAQTTITACPQGQFNPLCNFTTGSFGNIVAGFIQIIFVLAVLVALFYLIYGGFRWITSGGDKQAVNAARDHIVAAIIGLVVIFLSYFILNFLLGIFGLGSLSGGLTLPKISP